MATSRATSEWQCSVQVGTESSWQDSRRSFKPASEAASSEWPISTRARSESSWTDSRKSVKPDSNRSTKPDSLNIVRPPQKALFPSDVQDILETSQCGDNQIDEIFTEVTVRIGSLINASTFVVAQLPAGTPKPGDRAYELFRIESEMRKLYNTMEKTDKLVTEHHIKEKRDDPEFTTGTHVAVRRNPRSEYWHRGTVRGVAFYEDGAHADVFLIDYGDVVTDLSVFLCVRKLPQRLLDELQPFSFVLQLKDLVPVKMDLNREMGMTTMANVPTNRWSEAATKTVQEYLKASKALRARVSNWVVGKHDGRVYGDVELLDFKKPVNLNHVLLVLGFGIGCKGLHLLTADERLFEKKEIKQRFASIGSNYSDGLSDLPFPEIQDFVFNPNRGNLDVTDNTTLDNTIDRDWTSSANTTLNLEESLPDWRQIGDLQPGTSFASTLDLTGSSQIREELSAKHKKKYFYVPAGTDLGKDMEERLKRIPDDEVSGIGPKQLLPN